MRIWTRFLSVMLCALVLLSGVAGPALAAPRADHVFIISFDGGRPDIMQQSAMPQLFEMVKTGATSWNAQAVMPSITLVNHTSMVTGVAPVKHRILWNTWIPQQGLVKVPTAFQLARDNGYTTAIFAGKAKFRHLNVPGSLDEFQIPSYEAKTLAAAAGQYIVEKKPNLMLIHFADPDGAGHRHGWGSPEQKKAFAATDEALRVVREAVREAGIEKKSTFLMSADHGGHGKIHGSMLPEDMTIPWIAWGASVKRGFQIPGEITTYDTAATALWLLDVSIPSDWDGKPVQSAFSHSSEK